MGPTSQTKAKIEKKLAVSDSEKIPMFSRERHIQKINNCLNILESIDFNSNIDIIAHDIRLALRNTQENHREHINNNYRKTFKKRIGTQKEKLKKTTGKV